MKKKLPFNISFVSNICEGKYWNWKQNCIPYIMFLTISFSLFFFRLLLFSTIFHFTIFYCCRFFLCCVTFFFIPKLQWSEIENVHCSEIVLGNRSLTIHTKWVSFFCTLIWYSIKTIKLHVINEKWSSWTELFGNLNLKGQINLLKGGFLFFNHHLFVELFLLLYIWVFFQFNKCN